MQVLSPCKYLVGASTWPAARPLSGGQQFQMMLPVWVGAAIARIGAAAAYRVLLDGNLLRHGRTCRRSIHSTWWNEGEAGVAGVAGRAVVCELHRSGIYAGLERMRWEATPEEVRLDFMIWFSGQS